MTYFNIHFQPSVLFSFMNKFPSLFRISFLDSKSNWCIVF